MINRILHKYFSFGIGKNELLVSSMICCNSITMILGDRDGAVVLLLFASFLMFVMLNLRITLRHIVSKSLIILIPIILAFLVSIVFGNTTTTLYFYKFIVYGILFIAIPYYKLNLNKIIFCIFYIGLIYLPFYLTHDYGLKVNEYNEYDSGELMTISYRILIFIISSFLVFYKFSQKRIERLVSLLSFVFYGLILLIFGSRGAQLSVLTFLALFYINESKTTYQRKKRIFTLLCLVFSVVFAFVPILIYAEEWLETHNINVLAISRLYAKVVLESSDLTSERDVLAARAFSEFLESPLWGNGIGSFDNYSGAYPHNVFLHLLQEGGLVFFLPFFILFVRSLKIMSKRKTEYSYFLIFIFCSGIIQLFFSFYYWASQYFWIFIALLINRKYFDVKFNNRNYENSYINSSLHTSNSSKSV